MPHDGVPSALALLRSVWGLDHGLDRASKRMLRELGITGPQRVLLRLVVEAGEIHPGELAERMRSHPATVSTLLAKLERSGYVERRDSREDRRKTVVVATETGRALGARREGTIEACVEDVLASERPEDVSGCLRVLDALTRRLEQG